MLHRSAETATYAGDMAKVEINLPDDLLDQIDRVASRAGETRDSFLRRIAEREIAESNERFRREIEDMLDRHPIDLGGKSAAELIREDRDHRDDKRIGPDRDGD
jgi:predicted DNA-binding protein